MSLRVALFDRLRLDSAIAALVGQRIYPRLAPPDATYPLIVYTINANNPQAHMGGAAAARETRVQISSKSKSSTEVAALSEAVRLRIQGFIGKWGTVAIRAVFYDDESDSFVMPASGGPDAIETIHDDYVIWHDTTVPVH